MQGLFVQLNTTFFSLGQPSRILTAVWVVWATLMSLVGFGESLRSRKDKLLLDGRGLEHLGRFLCSPDFTRNELKDKLGILKSDWSGLAVAFPSLQNFSARFHHRRSTMISFFRPPAHPNQLWSPAKYTLPRLLYREPPYQDNRLRLFSLSRHATHLKGRPASRVGQRCCSAHAILGQ
jgi:hypothetical protein